MHIITIIINMIINIIIILEVGQNFTTIHLFSNINVVLEFPTSPKLFKFLVFFEY